MNHSEVLGFDASNMVFSTPRRPMTFAIMSARIESACLQTSSASIIIMSAPASKHLSALLINRSTSSTNSAERNRGNAHLISYNHTSDFKFVLPHHLGFEYSQHRMLSTYQVIITVKKTVLRSWMQERTNITDKKRQNRTGNIIIINKNCTTEPKDSYQYS